MAILLIEDVKAAASGVASSSKLKQLVTQSAQGKAVKPLKSVQEAIEALEKGATSELVICATDHPSKTLMKVLLELTAKIPMLLVVDQTQTADVVQSVKREGALLVVGPTQVGDALKPVIQKLLGVAPPPPAAPAAPKLSTAQEVGIAKMDPAAKAASATPDADFVKVPPKFVLFESPVKTDFFYRFAENNYVPVFKSGEKVDEASLQKCLTEKKLDSLFVKRAALPALLYKQNQNIDQAMKAVPTDETKSRALVSNSLEVMHDAVTKLGFTPEVQALAKRTAELTVKVIGKNPKLSRILTRMKMNEGQYITSHSMMLAEISGAMALRVGWNSAPTLLKLSLASFLHDLALTDNKLARFHVLPTHKTPGITPDMIQLIKLHPIRGGEFVRQFSEIPPDVDTIVIQHHERPDGTGFPKGLFHNQMSPLSCLFIMAHDLLNYLIEKGDQGTLEQFLKEKESVYALGTFKKLFKDLEKSSSSDESAPA